MNKVILFLSILLLTACSNNDNINNCNDLIDFGINFNLNLNLPQFSQLQFTSNSVYIANQGNGGLIVINVGTGLRAWDAADPSHQFSSCSILQIEGAIGKCGCSDANEYSLFTGGSLGVQLPCGLKEYRVSASGNNTYIISN